MNKFAARAIATLFAAFIVGSSLPGGASPPICPFSKVAKGAHGTETSCNENHNCVWYLYDDTCTPATERTTCVVATPDDPSYEIYACFQDPTDNNNWHCGTAVTGTGGAKNHTYATQPCP